MSTYQVRSLDEADQIIKEHERKTKTAYSLLRSTKNFGCIDVPACSNEENEVRFETVGVPYCGVPFFVAGLKILQCQSFRARGPKKRKEIKFEDNNSGLKSYNNSYENGVSMRSSAKGTHKKVHRFHKAGCTATIIMKEVVYYPEFQLYEHSKNNRVSVSRQLKDSFKAKCPIQKDCIIYVTVPAVTDHFGHAVGLGVPKNPCKRLYVKSNFYGCNEPGSSKRAYYPVKQEKFNVPQFIQKKIKMDEGDVDAKSKEVREMLQSIMALTYKVGTREGYNDLLKDLLRAKLKYQLSIENLNQISSPNENNTVACSRQPHIFTIQQQFQTKDNLISIPTEWQPRLNQTQIVSACSASSTIVTVSAVPIAISTNSGNVVSSSSIPAIHRSGEMMSPLNVAGSGTIPSPNLSAIGPNTRVQVVESSSESALQVSRSEATGSAAQVNSTNGSEVVNNQETSIFIEAMEAIFNSQM